MTTEASLTPTDLRLLVALERTRNLVHASRELGIDRDRAVYRLRRLDRLYGPVTTSERGGPGGGATRLNARGRRLLERAEGIRPGANCWAGTYRRWPTRQVVLENGARLDVTFPARDGEPVSFEVDAEAIVVAPRPVRLSARNALRTTVEAIRRRGRGTVELIARWDGQTVHVRLTAASIDRLGLAVGRAAYLYVKATSLRRLPWVPGGARPRRPGPLRS